MDGEVANMFQGGCVTAGRVALGAILLAGLLSVGLPDAVVAQSAAGSLPTPGSLPAPGSPPTVRSSQAVREFLGLGPVPDAEAAKRGAPIYAANCGFCHGPLARGAEGPSLIYSELVLKDEHGALLAQFLKGGRPEKGMPAFSTLADEQRKDLAEFLHQQVEDVANRGAYQVKNIVLGNPKKGASYVAAHCLGCHSLAGDLKGLSAKWRPIDLQRYWIMPPRTGDSRAITATVRAPGGEWQGRVQQIDDFQIVLEQSSGKPASGQPTMGQPIVIARDADVVVELHDPLAPHVAMVGNITDTDMINVTAYLDALR